MIFEVLGPRLGEKLDLAASQRPLGGSQGILDASWSLLEGSWSILGAPGAVSEASWSRLGSMWARHGRQVALQEGVRIGWQQRWGFWGGLIRSDPAGHPG